jgi:hypothetical protein
MEKIIAYCGLNCAECLAYKATQKEDEEEIKRIAKEWSGDDMSFKPEDIYCDGCNSESRIFSWCNVCDIRKCCREKQYENCAYCEEYICDNLKNCFEKSPSAKRNLDEIRKNL